MSALCCATVLAACGGGGDSGDRVDPLAEVNRDALASDADPGAATNGASGGSDGDSGDSGSLVPVSQGPAIDNIPLSATAAGSTTEAATTMGSNAASGPGTTPLTGGGEQASNNGGEAGKTGSGVPSIQAPAPADDGQALTGGPAGAAPGSYGALTFREEWNVSSLDTGKWLTRMFHWTTPELDNWRIEDGVLKMWTPRMANGQFLFENRAMNTDGKFTQRYGWFEMEAKLPRGRGLWPSFWLYAHNDHTRPEIDIMEAYGGGDQWWATADGRPIDYGATIWVSPEDGSSGDMISHQRPSWNTNVRIGDLTAGFHKYGALWEPDGITFFFDGQQIAPKVRTTRLNQQMYMIIGLGTGNPGTFNAPTHETPTTIANAFQINYVRAWALPQGTTTGGTHSDPTR